MFSFSPIKGSPEETFQRRLNQLCVEIWNLTERWCLLNKECCADLEKISNSRISLKKSNDKSEIFFLGEAIVRDSDHLHSTLLPSFSSVVKNLIKASLTLLPLKCSVDDLAKAEILTLSSSSVPVLQRKVSELCKILPPLLEMFQKEIEFKKDSINDFAFCDDSHECTVHLFSAIISSWQNHVYIDAGLLNCLYALVV